MPQNLMLELILFKILLSNLFLTLNGTDIASYADENTLCKGCNKVDAVLSNF